MPTPIKIWPDKACVVCGKLFNRHKYASGRIEQSVNFRRRLCCSEACGFKSNSATKVAKFRQEDKQCIRCGRTFNRYTHNGGQLQGIQIYRKKRCCSPECAAKEAGETRTKSVTVITRKAIQKRLRQTIVAVACERCGSSHRLHRHHRDHDWHNNERSNIEIVCQTCHVRHHQTKTYRPACRVCERPATCMGLCGAHRRRQKNHNCVFQEVPIGNIKALREAVRHKTLAAE